MNADELIASLGDGKTSTPYFKKMVTEALEKYSFLDTYTLRSHEKRLNKELELFGVTFRVVAGLHVINEILKERANQ